MCRRVIKCRNCEETFKTWGNRKIFCSSRCAKEYPTKNIPKWQREIPSTLLGAASEFAVIIDLIKRGIEPCRPIRSNAPFDVVFWRDGRAFRVEVRTAHNIHGKIKTAERGQYDILALVIHEEDRIIYRPKPEDWN